MHGDLHIASDNQCADCTPGFPAKPDLGANSNQAPQVSTTAQQAIQDGRPAKFSTLCIACHALEGTGGVVGPALDGVGTRYDKDYLYKWLADPQAVKPGTAMPKLPLTDSEVQELVTFLTGLK